MLKKIVLSVVVLGVVANATNLKVATGAGYKKPLMDVIKEYEKSGEKIDAFFAFGKRWSVRSIFTKV